MNPYKKKNKKPILCLDFDGVLHSYTSGWAGAANIVDPPVEGAISWLRSLLGCPDDVGIAERYEDFKIAIYSSRSKYPLGRWAMKRWLKRYGLTKYEIELISFPLFKPPAFLTLDDRAFLFTGGFPDPKELIKFTPWYRRPATIEQAIKKISHKFPIRDLIKFAKTPKEKACITLHHSVGRRIRNDFGLWQESELYLRLKDKGIEHPDDMSNYLLERLHEWLNSET